MKIINKSLFFIILLMFLLGFSSSVYAFNDDDHIELADYLNQMGLFLGSSGGYQLDEKPTRAQAAVMVVRLLGKEDEALASKLDHPFLDVPSWASPYVGYLYVNGISKGISDTLFGSDDLVNASQYMTFLLRILSYDDLIGDFNWQTSIQKAYDLNIINQDELNLYQSKLDFIRDDLVVLTYDVLAGNIKDSKGFTLIKKLVNEKAVPQSAMLDYIYAPYKLVDVNVKPENINDFQKYFFEAVIAYQDSITMDISVLDVDDLTTMINDAVDKLNIFPGYASVVDGWHAELVGYQLTIDINYLISKEEYEEASKKANQVATQLIKIGDSDYDTELLIHDYIIDHTKYYLGADNKTEIYTIYGIFVNQEAVCQGYADAFFYLTAYAGINCQLVYGTSTTEGATASHAWNIVKLEDGYYQVDITWDDPIMEDGTDSKNYNYFNITDEEIFKNHQEDENNYPICNAEKFNYYVYNDLMVDDFEGLKEALLNGFEDKMDYILYKVKDESVDMESLKDFLISIPVINSCSYSVMESGVVEITDIIYI